MKKMDRSTEYMYISARVRAIEAAMPGREMIARMIGATDLDGAAAVAVESGILRSADEAKNPDELDRILLARLRDAIDVVETDEGGRMITPIVRVSYDCANIKAALRCVPHGIDFSDLLFEVGSLPVERYGEMATSGDFSALPKNLAEAAALAKTDYATTVDPLKIDLPLDRACFADMLGSAEALGDGFAVDFVKTKIDMTNIMMIVRILGGGVNDMTRALASDALLDGGFISVQSIKALSESEETSVAEMREGLATLVRKSYPDIADILEDGGKGFENACDSLIEEKLRRAEYIPFGAPIVLAFLCRLEYEIKNVRIILAGKAAGLSPDEIAQRVRGSYV